MELCVFVFLVFNSQNVNQIIVVPCDRGELLEECTISNLRHGIVEAGDPVYGEKQVDYQAESSHRSRTVRTTSKTLEKSEEK